jgi:hypothetical protein
MKSVSPGVYRRKSAEVKIKLLARAVCGMRYEDAMAEAKRLHFALMERGEAILEEFRDADRRGRWEGK